MVAFLALLQSVMEWLHHNYLMDLEEFEEELERICNPIMFNLPMQGRLPLDDRIYLGSIASTLEAMHLTHSN